MKAKRKPNSKWKIPAEGTPAYRRMERNFKRLSDAHVEAFKAWINRQRKKP